MERRECQVSRLRELVQHLHILGWLYVLDCEHVNVCYGKPPECVLT